VARSTFTCAAWVISWGARNVSLPRRPTQPPVSPVGTSGTSPAPFPCTVPISPTRSAIATDRSGDPFTRAAPSASPPASRSPSSRSGAAPHARGAGGEAGVVAVHLELLGGRVEQLLPNLLRGREDRPPAVEGRL